MGQYRGRSICIENNRRAESRARQRLDEFEIDGLPGKNALEVIAELKSKL